MRRPAILAGCVAVAFAVALNSLYSFSLLPPSIHKRQLEVAGAAIHVVIDAPRSWALNDRTGPGEFSNLAHRADLLGMFVTSQPVLEAVARRMHVAPHRIGATTRITANVTNALSQANSEERATAIALSRKPYQIDAQTTPGRPVLNIYAQAPSVEEAKALAEASATELRAYVERQTAEKRIAPRWRIELERLGPARGGVINAGTAPQLFALTFMLALAGCLALLAGFTALRRRRDPAWAAASRPSPGPAGGGDWPRTTRVLPWTLAAFLGVIWLVPFNGIELTASLPFDLKFDRLVLPVIVGIWLLSLAVGGPAAPRVRVTPIHVALGAFVFAACLSVVLAGEHLNLANQFDLSIKRVFLLMSYALFFLVITSSVRPSEVRPFFKLTLGLALLTALGTIWEYRFSYNVFYSFADAVLPGVFQVAQASAGGVDMFGRQFTSGPAEHPLEAVGLLTMALPIALVGLLNAKGRKQTLLYALGACIVMSATIATYRKSALLAPASVCLVLLYFCRGRLLKLAPLAVPALFIVHLLSPGAFGSIVQQGGNLAVGTVGDRASDYDAVRPDLWSGLLFGRGYGSFGYRILDSEVLSRLIDSGVFGLAAYFALLVTVFAGARKLIHAGDPRRADLALAVAASTVAFIVLSFLFDVMVFPHTPYALLSLAGLLAVMLAAHDDDTRAAGPPPELAVPLAWPPDEPPPDGAGSARDDERELAGTPA